MFPFNGVKRQNAREVTSADVSENYVCCGSIHLPSTRVVVSFLFHLMLALKPCSYEVQTCFSGYRPEQNLASILMNDEGEQNFLPPLATPTSNATASAAGLTSDATTGRQNSFEINKKSFAIIVFATALTPPTVTEPV